MRVLCRRFAVSLLVAVITVVGCSTEGPIVPPVQPATQVIGATGGTVSTSDSSVVLTVPAGALDQETTITITAVTPAPEGCIGAAFEIGPTGTTFKQPATITLSYQGANLGLSPATDLRLTRQAAGGDWEELESWVLDHENQTVSAETTHLSLYSLRIVQEIQAKECAEPPEATGGFCTKRGLKCKWDQNYTPITEGWCDGTNWVTAAREPGCTATHPSGTCGTFDGICKYLGAFHQTIEEGWDDQFKYNRQEDCLAYFGCNSEGKWEVFFDCQCPPQEPPDDGLGDCEIKKEVAQRIFSDVGTSCSYVQAQACTCSSTDDQGTWTRTFSCSNRRWKPDSSFTPAEP